MPPKPRGGTVPVSLRVFDSVVKSLARDLATETLSRTKADADLSESLELLQNSVVSSDVLEGYAKKEDLPDLGPYALKTEIPSLDSYATTDSVASVLQSYATKSYVSSSLQSYAKKTDLNGYATLSHVSTALLPYALKTDIPATPDLAPYALKTEVAPGYVAYGPSTSCTPDETLMSHGRLVMDWKATPGHEGEYELALPSLPSSPPSEPWDIDVRMHVSSVSDGAWLSLFSMSDAIAVLHGSEVGPWYGELPSNSVVRIRLLSSYESGAPVWLVSLSIYE